MIKYKNRIHCSLCNSTNTYSPRGFILHINKMHKNLSANYKNHIIVNRIFTAQYLAKCMHALSENPKATHTKDGEYISTNIRIYFNTNRNNDRPAHYVKQKSSNTDTTDKTTSINTYDSKLANNRITAEDISFDVIVAQLLNSIQAIVKEYDNLAGLPIGLYNIENQKMTFISSLWSPDLNGNYSPVNNEGGCIKGIENRTRLFVISTIDEILANESFETQVVDTFKFCKACEDYVENVQNCAIFYLNNNGNAIPLHIHGIDFVENIGIVLLVRP